MFIPSSFRVCVGFVLFCFCVYVGGIALCVLCLFASVFAHYRFVVCCVYDVRLLCVGIFFMFSFVCVLHCVFLVCVRCVC